METLPLQHCGACWISLTAFHVFVLGPDTSGTSGFSSPNSNRRLEYYKPETRVWGQSLYRRLNHSLHELSHYDNSERGYKRMLPRAESQRFAEPCITFGTPPSGTDLTQPSPQKVGITHGEASATPLTLQGCGSMT